MNEETMTPATSGMTVSQGMKDDLLTTAKWMKFLCIIGCIGAAIMVIIGIAMVALGTTIGGLAGSAGSTVGRALSGYVRPLHLSHHQGIPVCQCHQGRLSLRQ